MTDIAASSFAAAWFLSFVAPLCLYVAWSDLARMKIPNGSVIALLAVFVVVGVFVLPFETYLWRLGAAIAVFAVGLGLYFIGGIGAGDVKFAAAIAPFFDHGDFAAVLYLLAATTLAGFAAHRLLRRVGALRRAAPGWVSWTSERFPMGISLASSLLFYLLATLVWGS